ncbi:MAG TPA: cupredoxin domain-containing protein [Coriobacteriia bacterium]
MRSLTAGSARLVRPVAVCAAALLLLGALAGCSASGSAPTGGGSPAGTSAAGVQHFDVDLSTGAYKPAELDAKAGTPVQITFGQGQGCVQTLVFPSFNIKADMAQGPKTFDLGVLQPGDYPWACGMNMQHGVLKVR